MALSPSEAFLSDNQLESLVQLEKRVDELLKDYSGGNRPIHFTHTLKGDEEMSSPILNVLMERYKKAGWGSVQHVITKEGRGISLKAWKGPSH